MKIYNRDSKGRFVSKKQDEELTKIEDNKNLIIAINNRITQLEKYLESKVPEIVKKIIETVIPTLTKDFVPAKLEIIKPTPTDPIVKYDGKIICWYL